MRKIIISAIIIIVIFFNVSCLNEHIHKYENGKCECGEIKILTVTFIDTLGDKSIVEVRYGEKVKPVQIEENSEYKFIGWFYEDSLFDFGKPIFENIEITSKYQKIEKYTVTFKDHLGNILSEEIVEKGASANPPSIPERNYFKFVGWNQDYSNINSDLIIYPIYEMITNEYKITYVIDDKYFLYQNKEEMVFEFLNDFYDFIKPIESKLLFIYGDKNYPNGYWVNYIGGSEGKENYLLYNNDIDLDNDDYFLNSSLYKDKWYKLSSYMKNYICKSNKRFGYPEKEYNYGALDFKRYMINDPNKYIDTYGGEQVFYGYPSDDKQKEDVYYYGEDNQLENVFNQNFGGWYLDNDYQYGPYYNIDSNTYGDIVLFGKILDEPAYSITFNTKCDEKIEKIFVRKNEEVKLPVLSREGYTFGGWYCDNTLYTDSIKFDYNVSINLEAKWFSHTETNYNKLVYNNEVITYRGSVISVDIPDKYNPKEKELRAVWVSSMIKNFTPSSNPEDMKKELNYVIDLLDSYNINCVIFHLRTHNNSFYKSKLAPIKEEYGTYETLEEWDYLPWFIEECHKKGIDFHAWLNPYRISLSGLSMDTTTEDIAKKYKDYLLNPAHNPENILMTYSPSEENQGAILNPAKEAVQNHILDVVRELINNYNIDGIHFDDYFYQKLDTDSDILNDADQVDYEQYIRKNPGIFDANNSDDKKDWRRMNVDDLIYKLSIEIKNFNIKYEKSIEFGISPTGVYKSGDGTVEGGSNTTLGGHYGANTYADSVKWVKNEWLDYIMPQCYTSFNNMNYSFQDVTTWWNKVVEGTNVNLYIGIGIHKSIDKEYQYSWKTEKEEMINQLLYLTTLDNVDGVCLFSFHTFKTIHNDSSIISNYAFGVIKEKYWNEKKEIPQTKADIHEKK